LLAEFPAAVLVFGCWRSISNVLVPGVERQRSNTYATGQASVAIA